MCFILEKKIIARILFNVKVRLISFLFFAIIRMPQAIETIAPHPSVHGDD